MNTLDGKTIVIDVVEYRLVAVCNELHDNRTKAILSMQTLFGVIKNVVDRNELKDGIDEGEYDINGCVIAVEFCREDEVKDKLGDVDECSLLDIFFSSLGEYLDKH